jgi:hypothetical protein
MAQLTPANLLAGSSLKTENRLFVLKHSMVDDKTVWTLAALCPWLVQHCLDKITVFQSGCRE